MSGEWYDTVAGWPVVVTFLSVVCVGLVVKLMDDVLDVEYDTFLGKKTLAHRLGRASLPYGLLLLGIAMYTRPTIALTLFLASYVIGMGHELREKMPTKLTGWMESLIVFLVMVVLTNVNLTVWAISIMVVIQLLDDISDMRDDAKSGQRNFAVRYGVVEVTFILLIAFAIAVFESTTLTIVVLLSVPVIHFLLRVIERRFDT